MSKQQGPNHRGAPSGNRNSLRHGLRAGRLPPGCNSIRHAIDELRRQLEDAVLSVHGQIDIVAAAQIQSAVRWERHAMLAQRWLRLRADLLQPAELLAFSRDIARASSERDKVINALNLTSRKNEFDPEAQLRARALQNRPSRIEQAVPEPDVILDRHLADGAIFDVSATGNEP